ncbi:hypothetical protein GQ44DRAFT_416397 [Phaeosphaeriaceae sp. PMI808]|nr:hypothetical protein GQ44DRAFT_416397 [Phaeosphaeriaceae sp. PMI808]
MTEILHKGAFGMASTADIVPSLQRVVNDTLQKYYPVPGTFVPTIFLGLFYEPNALKSVGQLGRLQRAKKQCAGYANAAFVKVEHSEDAVEKRITEAYVEALNDENCKHILFAAWKRPMYMHLLQTAPKKVILVEGRAMGEGWKMIKLPCRYISFPAIFIDRSEGDRVEEHYEADSKKEEWQSNAIGELVLDKYRRHPLDSWCSTHSCSLPHAPATPTPPKPTGFTFRVPGNLPPHPKPDHIAVNKDKKRIDAVNTPPSRVARQAYRDKSKSTGVPCNRHHLTAKCEYKGCKKSHSAVSSKVLTCVRFLARQKPCPWGSECEETNCFLGHVCQDERCSEAVREHCKLKRFHGVDPKFVAWIRVKDRDAEDTDFSEEEE